MARKAKWLEEATNAELLEIIKEGLGSSDTKVVNKAKKALAELLERTPDSDGEVSVEEAIEAAAAALENIKVAYESELEAVDEDEEADDEEDDEDDEDEDDLESMTKKELYQMAKEMEIPGITRKTPKDELIEAILDAEDEEDDEEDDAPDYEDMSKSELLAECKERGLKCTRKTPKADLIDMLEEDDEE